MEDPSRNGTTFWKTIMNGAENDDCRLAHSQPNTMQMCGANKHFESHLDNPVGNNYSSTLTVIFMPPNFNGTIVECDGPRAMTEIGHSTICITGKTIHFHLL